MNLTAKQLSGEHIGKTVTVPFDGQQVTGTLTKATHQADIITEQALCETKPRYGIGHQWVHIELWGNFEETENLTITLNPNTPITIQEEQ